MFEAALHRAGPVASLRRGTAKPAASAATSGRKSQIHQKDQGALSGRFSASPSQAGRMIWPDL